jgi:uncharacterized membrane protein YqjE
MAESAAAATAAAGTAAPRSAAVPPPPLLSTLRALWQELPGLLSDRVELLSLELQRAGHALVRIVMLVVAAAILGGTAWLVLWGGIVITLVVFGLHLAWALAAAGLINVAAAFWAVARARRLLALLRLPVTRRHLTISPAPQPPPAAPPLDGPTAMAEARIAQRAARGTAP